MLINTTPSSKKVLKRLMLNHVTPYKKQILLAMFFMIIVALCSAIIVRLVKPAIDEVFINHDRKMLIILPLIMMGIYSLKGMAEYFQSYIIKYIGQQVLTNLQILMYEHLLFSDFLFIQSQASGSLISSFTNDISLMRSTVSNVIVGCAKHLLSVLFLIMVMFSLDPYISTFIFLAFPATIYPIQKLGDRIKNITGEVQEELSNFTAHLDETFYAFKVIKSFATEEIEVKRAKNITTKILAFYKKAAKLDSLTSPVMETFSGLAIACVIWYGGYTVIEGKMTTGALFAFITAFISAYRPFKSLISLNLNLQEGLAATNRIFNILDRKPNMQDNDDVFTPEINNPEIEFRNVIVQFNTCPTISDLNLRIDAGKTYAFVGESGSGKTTIANLLVRFFDPTQGEILINQVDIKKIALKHLQHNISMVNQDVILFNISIADNIAYGCQQYSIQDIVAAAKAANAHDFIEMLPHGYNTIIGPSGSTLSGGQRQRLSIARAFMKNAPILLFDEATSALDNHSEQFVVNSIRTLKKNRTTLIITHRLSSIRNVDRIVVMKNGRIAEQGTHEELLKLKQEYCKLYNKELQEDPDTV